jgi:hypothetical protein
MTGTLTHVEEPAVWNDALEGDCVDVAVEERVGNSIYGVEDGEERGQTHSGDELQKCAEQIGVVHGAALAEGLLDLVVVLQVLLIKERKVRLCPRNL